MPDALVDRLRAAAGWVERQDTPAPDWDALLAESADEIDRLSALLAGEGTAQADPRATGVTWRNIVTCTGDASYAAARGGTAHACPEGDDGVTPCCGRSPLDLPITDQLTTCDDLVTCNG